MDPEVVGFLAQVAVIVVVTASALATVAVIALRAVVRTRRLPPPAQQDDRLEHLQQSVDAIAVEVERIAEAQRFSAKLLAGRSEGSPSSR
jgi:peptidoglycan hydrolase CwlO-like protein